MTITLFIYKFKNEERAFASAIHCNSTLCVGVNLEGDRSTVLVLVACCLMLSNNLMFYTILTTQQEGKRKGKKGKKQQLFFVVFSLFVCIV